MNDGARFFMSSPVCINSNKSAVDLFRVNLKYSTSAISNPKAMELAATKSKSKNHLNPLEFCRFAKGTRLRRMSGVLIKSKLLRSNLNPPIKVMIPASGKYVLFEAQNRSLLKENSARISSNRQSKGRKRAKNELTSQRYASGYKGR